MIRLESDRLWIYPIDNEAIKDLITNEKDADLRQAYSEMLQGCIDNPQNRIWYTVWFIELKNHPQTIVGDLSFKGLNPDGMIEIGYGLKDGFCKKGYMTEAVKTVCAWAITQPNITRIEAETEPDNEPSQFLLARVGFTPTGTSGEEGPRFIYHKAKEETK